MPVTWEQAAVTPQPLPKQWCLASKMVQASTIHILRCGYTKLQPLRAVFTQPTQVLSHRSNLWAWASSTQHTSGHGSPGWGVQEGADHLFQVSLHAMLQTSSCVLLSSEAPPLSWLIPTQWRDFLGWSPHFPISFFLLLSYPSYMESFLPFPEFGCLLPVFSRYSLRINPYVDVFLINLWEEVGFMFTTLSSWFRSQ